MWKRSAFGNYYDSWNGGKFYFFSLLINFFHLFFVGSLFLLILYLLILPTNSFELILDCTAYSLAFSVEDDYSTNLHWCCGHGKSCVGHFNLIFRCMINFIHSLYDLQIVWKYKFIAKLNFYFCRIFSLANEMTSLLLYRCAGVSQNCGGIGHIATICWVSVKPVLIYQLLRYDITNSLNFFNIYNSLLIVKKEPLFPVSAHIAWLNNLCLMQELLARLVVLLHNPLAREQLATQILTVS